MKVSFIFSMFLYLIIQEVIAQVLPKHFWSIQKSGVESSIRGMSAVNENVCWIGTKGKVLLTVDGGKTWKKLPIPGADSLDFRDIQAFDENSCLAMSSGSGSDSRIYKTSDGGENWVKVNENNHIQGFYNGMAFWDEKTGLLAGDPVAEVPYLVKTIDGGETWSEIAIDEIPPLKDGEYGFAASGTHIVTQGDSSVYIGTGGSVARVFYSKDQGDSWTVANTPMVAGKASQGIFSLAFKDSLFGMAVGGDYTAHTKESQDEGNVIFTRNGGQTLQLSEGVKLDYRSCVKFARDFIVVAGPSGTDISYNAGASFEKISEHGFHTIAVSPDGKTIWAAGSKGLIAKLQIE